VTGDGAQDVWNSCASALREQVSDAVWHSCFQEIRPLDFDEITLRLTVPSGIVRDRIQSRYESLVANALADIGRADVEVNLVVLSSDPPIDAITGEADTPIPASADDTVFADLGPVTTSASSSDTEGLGLDDTDLPGPTGTAGSTIRAEQTFESFVIGSSNHFAHAAALRVAETPARSYNPLTIYGPSGLGKTHLLHAIGNYIHQNYPTYTVRYVRTELFLYQYVDAIRKNTGNDFKRRYRDIDVLLVDDIHFLETREGLQEEFFHTFNALHEASRQIVLTSDRPPDAIATLEDRLRSRFKMGLVTDIQPPELETRLAILRMKAERELVDIPEEVLEFIATHVTTNIRELEGALHRLTAYMQLRNTDCDLAMAERILLPLLGDIGPEPITVDTILAATSAKYRLEIDEITGASRRRPLVLARQVAMYVCRELTDLSYPVIAEAFGGRDHTTVIHAVRKISEQMKEKEQVYDQVTELLETIKKGT
jgi:chromosomal replication initiator protein